MLVSLVDQIYWANAASITWIEKESKDLALADFAPIVKLMSHVLNAGNIWICRATQREFEKDSFKSHGIPEMILINESNHKSLLALIEGDIKRVMHYTLLNGSPGQSTIEEMMIHVFSHGFHHMGQMAALASNLARPFPNVSYIGFTRKR